MTQGRDCVWPGHVASVAPAHLLEVCVPTVHWALSWGWEAKGRDMPVVATARHQHGASAWRTVGTCQRETG